MRSLFILLQDDVAIINGQEARVGDFLCVGAWKSEILSIEGNMIKYQKPNCKGVIREKNWTKEGTWNRAVIVERAE